MVIHNVEYRLQNGGRNACIVTPMLAASCKGREGERSAWIQCCAIGRHVTGSIGPNAIMKRVPGQCLVHVLCPPTHSRPPFPPSIFHLTSSTFLARRSTRILAHPPLLPIRECRRPRRDPRHPPHTLRRLTYFNLGHLPEPGRYPPCESGRHRVARAVSAQTSCLGCQLRPSAEVVGAANRCARTMRRIPWSLFRPYGPVFGAPLMHWCSQKLTIALNVADITGTTSSSRNWEKERTRRCTRDDRGRHRRSLR